MSTAASRVLRDFEKLTDDDQRAIRRVIVEQVPVSDDLTDDDYAALAAAAFRALGEEEDGQRA